MISDGSATRPSAVRELTNVNISGVQALEMSVLNVPHMIALTRTFGAKVCARPSVSEFRPALAAAYGTIVAFGRTDAVEEMLRIAPPFAAAILVPTFADSRNGPLRLIANTLS